MKPANQGSIPVSLYPRSVHLREAMAPLTHPQGQGLADANHSFLCVHCQDLTVPKMAPEHTVFRSRIPHVLFISFRSQIYCSLSSSLVYRVPVTWFSEFPSSLGLGQQPLYSIPIPYPSRAHCPSLGF